MKVSIFASNEDIEILLRELERMPVQIKAQHDELRQMDSGQNLESAMKLREMEIASAVEAEVSKDTGKKAFPNAQSRENETGLRLSKDEEYQAWSREVSGIKLGRSERESELYTAKDRFRGLCAKAGLLAALIVSESTARDQATTIKETING